MYGRVLVKPLATIRVLRIIRVTRRANSKDAVQMRETVPSQHRNIVPIEK